MSEQTTGTPEAIASRGGRPNPSIKEGKTKIDGSHSFNTISIDPSQMDFVDGELTLEAKGTELWKCKGWDFDSQICNGDWIKLKNIYPGEEYKIIIDAADPAFAGLRVDRILQHEPDSAFR